jgi:hypothetical protein
MPVLYPSAHEVESVDDQECADNTEVEIETCSAAESRWRRAHNAAAYGVRWESYRLRVGSAV